MADDLKTSLKAVLDLLEAGLVDDDLAAMMLQAAIIKQTQAPAYIAFQKAYRAYVDQNGRSTPAVHS